MKGQSLLVLIATTAQRLPMGSSLQRDRDRDRQLQSVYSTHVTLPYIE